MTPKMWLEKPKLVYSKDILDIVQFGSSVIEGKESNDIDMAVIFKKIPLKEQLTQAQEIKKQLQKSSGLPIHISALDLNSLFDKSNFSREGLLIYGRSLISGRYFSENFGLIPKIQISYSLKSLKKKDKVRFHYMLKGRGGKYGLLKEHGGELINPGMIEILPEHEEIVINSVSKLTSEFKVQKIFHSKA